MKRTAFALAAAMTLGALVQSTPAFAQQEGRQFAVEGAGRWDCATYLTARADKGSAEYQRLIGFVEGYLSAANRYEPNTFDLSPWHNAMAFDIIIEGHCSQHEQDTLISVLQRMVTGFRTIRIARFSSLLEVGSGDQRAYVYEAVLERSQAALRNLGFYRGTETGQFDPATRDAFAEFQRSRNLEPTGIPDPATLWMLLDP